MDIASSTRAVENRKRRKGIVTKLSVVAQRPCMILGKENSIILCAR